jgi:hypothetical protein
MIKANILSHSHHPTTTYKVTEGFLCFSFLCGENPVLLEAESF